MLKRFNVQGCKGSPSPMEDRPDISEADDVIAVLYCELVGSLMYLSQVSRPDIAFATSYLSNFLDRPTRYVKGTSDKRLVYQKCPDECSQMQTGGVTRQTARVLSGMASFHCGNLVSWSSKKQPIVDLSSVEAEYTLCNMAASDPLYLKGLRSEFVGETGVVKCCLMVDNQGAIHMINYENTKHFEHFPSEKTMNTL
ncbi:hypothetical protein PR048_031406, partial [Dryococelus australis]